MSITFNLYLVRCLSHCHSSVPPASHLIQLSSTHEAEYAVWNGSNNLYSNFDYTWSVDNLNSKLSSEHVYWSAMVVLKYSMYCDFICNKYSKHAIVSLVTSADQCCEEIGGSFKSECLSLFSDKVDALWLFKENVFVNCDDLFCVYLLGERLLVLPTKASKVCL